MGTCRDVGGWAGEASDSLEIVRFGEYGAGVAEPGQRRWTQDPLP